MPECSRGDIIEANACGVRMERQARHFFGFLWLAASQVCISLPPVTAHPNLSPVSEDAKVQNFINIDVNNYKIVRQPISPTFFFFAPEEKPVGLLSKPVPDGPVEESATQLIVSPLLPDVSRQPIGLLESVDEPPVSVERDVPLSPEEEEAPFPGPVSSGKEGSITAESEEDIIFFPEGKEDNNVSSEPESESESPPSAESPLPGEAAEMSETVESEETVIFFPQQETPSAEDDSGLISATPAPVIQNKILQCLRKKAELSRGKNGKSLVPQNKKEL